MNKTRDCGILEELRLCTAGISNNTDVDVTSQVDAFMSKLVDTTQEHKQDCPLDILVTKHSWGNAINKLIEEIGSISHSLNII
jgi:hypothetical protein